MINVKKAPAPCPSKNNNKPECINDANCYWIKTSKKCRKTPRKSSQKNNGNNNSNSKFNSSPQLNMLIKQLHITQLRDLIEPDITNDEVNQLMSVIRLNETETLMDVANTIIENNQMTNPDDILNVKISVLLDNLARKLCNCTGYLEQEQNEKKLSVNINAACRRRIFLNRNIDFITYDCGETEVNQERFNYGVGPLLKPKLRSKDKYILRRPIKK
jgi:hypothetical protein